MYIRIYELKIYVVRIIINEAYNMFLSVVINIIQILLKYTLSKIFINKNKIKTRNLILIF